MIQVSRGRALTLLALVALALPIPVLPAINARPAASLAPSAAAALLRPAVADARLVHLPERPKPKAPAPAPAPPQARLLFSSPRAELAGAPLTATLAVPGPAGVFRVPYIQTSPDLAFTIATHALPGRGQVQVVLDEGTDNSRELLLPIAASLAGTFEGIDFGEHTLSAYAYGSELDEKVRPQHPLASARLEQVARGDIVAAIGDSTTEGVGEEHLPAAQLNSLRFFSDWLAARRAASAAGAWWVSGDGRNFPQTGPTLKPASRPSFTVRLGQLVSANRGRPVLVVNEGWSGATVDSTVRLMESDYIRAQLAILHPTEWVINLGANDAKVGWRPTDYLSRLVALVADLEGRYGAQRPAIHIACPSIALQPGRKALEQAYLPVVNQVRSMYSLGSAPNFFGMYKAHAEWLADLVHPNESGYQAMAEMWAEALMGQNSGCG